MGPFVNLMKAHYARGHFFFLRTYYVPGYVLNALKVAYFTLQYL